MHQTRTGPESLSPCFRQASMSIVYVRFYFITYSNIYYFIIIKKRWIVNPVIYGKNNNNNKIDNFQMLGKISVKH